MFDELMERLNNTGIPFRESGWAVAPATDYGVIDIDGGGASEWADDRIVNQAVQGTIDLYTRGAGRAQMKTVQEALNEAGVSWRFNSCQYEEDTKLMHYEWVFELEAI